MVASKPSTEHYALVDVLFFMDLLKVFLSNQDRASKFSFDTNAVSSAGR